MSFTNERNLTKFIWRIENFSCLKDGSLQSPSFRSHSVLWKLKIYPSLDNKYINLNLKQLDDKVLSVNCSIAFIDSNGLPLIWREYKKNRYTRSQTRRMKPFNIDFIYVTRDDLFGAKKSKFLFNDTLRVECQIWEKSGIILDSQTCLAETRFEIYPLQPLKKTFVLKVNDVSSLSPNHTLEHFEQMRDRGLLNVRVTFSDEQEFQTSVMVPPLTTHANFKVSVLNAAKKRYEFADVEFDFGDEIQEKSFSTQITKFMLMTYRNEFLPNDSLSLEFKCSLLYKITFNRLVEINENFFNNIEQTVLPLSNQEAKTKTVKPDAKTEIKSDQPTNVFQTLKNIYEEGFLPDSRLKVGDKEFPVHKVILGARSSVFRAMFTTDMKEKERGLVDIPDVDTDTIQRMLKFVYCDSVEEDLQWESVSSLYSAADKYALEPLKQRCADILKSELCVSSVLGALLLADAHQDEDMRAAALDFILEHDKQIFGNESWSKFAEEHSKLAFDTIQKVYFKKMEG